MKALLILITLLVGSHAVADSLNHSFDIQSIIRDAKLGNSQKADKLAEFGESLMSPLSIMSIEEIFDAALTLDPKNAKARLYKSAIQITKPLKGLLNRIYPLVATQSYERQQRYAEFINIKLLKSPARSFLLDGPQDIMTELDLQEVAVLIIERLNDFRKLIGEIKQTHPNLTFFFNRLWGQTKILPVEFDACSVRRQGTIYYFGDCLSLVYIKTIKQVTSIDLELLQQLIGAYQVTGLMITGYDLSGFIRMVDDSETYALTAKQVKERLVKMPRFGRIMNRFQIAKILPLALDLQKSYAWAQKNKNDVCRDRSSAIAESGYCLDTKPSTALSSLIPYLLQALFPADHKDVQVKAASFPYLYKVLNWPSRSEEFSILSKGLARASYEKVFSKELDKKVLTLRSEINPLVVMVTPPSDLKNLFPDRFDKCGNMTHLSDPTLAGFFPKGDAAEVIRFLEIVRTECK
jgi:hypothetical protein